MAGDKRTNFSGNRSGFGTYALSCVHAQDWTTLRKLALYKQIVCTCGDILTVVWCLECWHEFLSGWPITCETEVGMEHVCTPNPHHLGDACKAHRAYLDKLKKEVIH